MENVTFEFENQEDGPIFLKKFELLLNTMGTKQTKKPRSFKIVNYPKNLKRKELYSGKFQLSYERYFNFCFEKVKRGQ